MQELTNERKDDQAQELMNDRTDDQALKIHKILKNVPSLSKLSRSILVGLDNQLQNRLAQPI